MSRVLDEVKAEAVGPKRGQAPPTCYVCGKPIYRVPRRLPGGLYRHVVKCEPGSEEYMKNRKLARRYRKLFAKGG